MARYDIKLVTELPGDMSTSPLIAAGTTQSVLAGTPTIGSDATAASPWTGYVQAMATSEPTTSQRFTGIAKSDSAETTSASGAVQLWLPLPGIIYSCNAEVAANANTSALIDALRYKRVTLNLASSVWTVNTAAADSASNGIVIIGGEYQVSKIYFVVAVNTTAFYA